MNSDGSVLHYIVLGEMACHLVEQTRVGSVEEFPAVFRALEGWIADGDEYVAEAAVVGLIEGLQNVAGNRGLDPDLFLPWLGPRARRGWDELNALWQGVTPKG